VGLTRIDEQAPPLPPADIHAIATPEPPLDYDQMFSPANPEYVEYRHAWQQVQQEFAAPSTPRSLLLTPELSPTHKELQPLELNCLQLALVPAEATASIRSGASTPVTALALLRSASPSGSGGRTPRALGVAMQLHHRSTSSSVAAVAMDSALALPDALRPAAAKADMRAAHRHAELDAPAAQGRMDWDLVLSSLAQLEADST
jgi:hypothetical protein